MEKTNKNSKVKCTSIGGQAVMEGVMMQGATAYCTAVRDPEGVIQVERLRLNRSPAAVKASKIPFVRGVVNMFSSLVRGTKTLMRSAQVYGGDDEEPGRFQRWLAEKFKVDLMEAATFVSALIGVLLAVALFMILPNLAVEGLVGLFPSLAGSVWEYVLLGVFKLIIFLAYLGLILLLKDIQRLYRYHGAEHKTINCYEKGLPLTPENVKGCSRIHDRCGTSFLFIVLIINILIISLVCWGVGVNRIENNALRTLARLGIEVILLPLIAGIGYEILKLLAKFHGPISLIFKSPGILLQKVFTTREPDLEMIEVAIAAFNAAQEMDADPDMPETHFVIGGILSPMLKDTKKLFAEKGIDESDAEWIYSLVLNIPRSQLEDKERVVKPSEAKKVEEIVHKRLTGRPLWYVIGDTEFYGCKIKVDERALIPRPETEILAEHAIKTVEEGDKVLDLCTGSGCIAIAIAKNCAGKRVQVTASDVSDAAIMLAKENANYNSVDITFIQSDLFSKIHGRFNLIVCNPPYIKTSEIPALQREVRDWEPRIALDGGEDGLDFYRRLAREISRYIAKGGMLMLEVGEGQAEEVLKLFEKRDYAMVVKDYQGVDRILKIAF
ncbi:MAG TPA: peptide chain release factor N(5)-glutamine methyltransferase [Candidatus Coproplasma excrementipullorum]|nr:peptide chain release factor N(5)-glutamine methyltransferase [Candidatus Coproplasma excrementipullorum]